MLIIEQSVIDQLIDHALRAAPVEACGFLAAKEGVVCLLLALRNLDQSPVHFTLDPEEQFSALRKIRNAGLKHCAIYHSHLVSPACPSQEDIRLAYDSSISHVIISLATIPPDIKSYKIFDGKVSVEEIGIAKS